jgi:hypothetical protein
MNGMAWTGAALLTDLDLAPLRCLICDCAAGTATMRVTRIEDGCWLAVCDDCCEFFCEVPHDFCGGSASAWRRTFRIHDAAAHAAKSCATSGTG